MADFAIQNDIYIGSVENPIDHFDNARIVGSPSGIFSLDLIGNELTVDTLTVVIKYDPYGEDALVYAVRTDTDPWDGEYLLYETAEKTTPPIESAALYCVAQTAPSAYLDDVPNGTPVFWYVGGAYYAKFYLKAYERTSPITWKLTCDSGVGLLDTVMHKGGLYTGQTFGTIATSIIGGAFAFNFEVSLRDVPVYGHLPFSSSRNNLHTLLFAVGGVMRKSINSTNDYNFLWLGNTITEIPASRVSINGSVARQLPATRAEIAEHAFYQTTDDETVTLFDNTGSGASAAVEQLVVFEKSPVYGLTTTGSLTVDESNCNYAIVTGIGTLTGKLYQHTIKIVAAEDTSGGEERVARVTDNELVSAVNSWNVARRVLNYYSSTKTVKGKLVLASEKPGDLVQATDAFGDPTQGYISKLEMTPTSVKGASVEIVDGFIADASGNNYTQLELITASGSWVASKTGPIRLVIIQGGTGGQGGRDGSPGLAGIRHIPGGLSLPMDVSYTTDGGSLYPARNPPYTAVDYYEETHIFPGRKLYYVGAQAGRPGGAAGAGGAQGKVYVIDLDVTVGDTIDLTIGAGGVGGDANGGLGTAGTHTTATYGGTTYSSADGTTNGYYDPISRTSFGQPGKRGVAGGRGGTSGLTNSTGCDGGNGVDGGSVAGFAGGKGGTGTGQAGQAYPAGSGLENFVFLANGSGGGGAAYGNAGSPGGTFTTENYLIDGNYAGIRVSNAPGGAGASALAPLKASYGNGGDGGNGGGAGGNASGVFVRHAYFVYNGYGMTPGGFYGIGDGGNDPAPGGVGSAGGDGGDGCVIIYY